jgi:hypothetical protein
MSQVLDHELEGLLGEIRRTIDDNRRFLETLANDATSDGVFVTDPLDAAEEEATVDEGFEEL